MPGVIIITGASRGIGAAAARVAAREGFAVCLNAARSIDAARAVADEIVAGGGRAIAVQADVSCRDEVQALFSACDRHGKTAAFMASDRQWMQDYLARGFRLMAYGLDISIFQNALAEGLQFMRSQAPAPASPGRKRAKPAAGARAGGRAKR